MKEAYNILKELKQLGGQVYLEDSSFNLDINPDLLTEEMIQRIKDHKAEIIAFIEKGANQTESIPVESAEGQINFPISDAQRRLWVICQFAETSVAFNMPDSIHLNQDIDMECFKKAIYAVIERHEILRTVFRHDENRELRQWVLDTDELKFKIDYKDFSIEENTDELLKNYRSKDMSLAFDFEQGPLIRMAVLKVSEDKYIFYYNMHHIISDGWVNGCFGKRCHGLL